jgi:hypothetical protein
MSYGMGAMGGPVGSGVPNQYPLAISTPLDRAYLRPLQQPVYDTEAFPFTAPPLQLTWFTRPNASTTQFCNQSKFLSETNLNQSAMLDYPREFSILGFTYSLDSTIGLKAQGNILRRAWFEFTFSGNRPYLQIAADRLPAGIGLEGACAMGNVSSNTDTNGIITCFKSGLGHMANYYKFNLGRSALKIKPGEAFKGTMNWPVAAWANSTTLQGLAAQNDFYGQTETAISGFWCRCSLIGLSWQPL